MFYREGGREELEFPKPLELEPKPLLEFDPKPELEFEPKPLELEPKPELLEFEPKPELFEFEPKPLLEFEPKLFEPKPLDELPNPLEGLLEFGPFAFWLMRFCAPCIPASASFCGL
jgi:hypothetical protein